MLLTSIPAKFQVPWAASATVGYITSPIPYSTGAAGRASLLYGFPPTTFEPEASGGNPPYGADANGIINQITQWTQWYQAGGAIKWDATFSSQISGYPLGATVQAATLGNGSFWIASVDANTTDPDTGGAGWIQWPDLPIQLQKPNYGVDTGAVNVVTISLSPAPTSWAQIVGAPVRFKAAHANSVNNPTITINGLTAATMVNPDGSALAIAQYGVATIVEGIPRDDGKFQVNTPAAATTVSGFFTGCIQPWATETVPSGWLELNGALLNIADYPNLYNVPGWGTRYGGDGITTFKLPDWRGEFIRGWDHGRGLDPDSAYRTNAGGGLTGDHVGTNQIGIAGPISFVGPVEIDNLQTYTAFSSWGGLDQFGQSDIGGGTVSITYLNQGTITPPVTGTGDISKLRGTGTLSGSSGSETRPVNIYAMWIVKT